MAVLTIDVIRAEQMFAVCSGWFSLTDEMAAALRGVRNTRGVKDEKKGNYCV